MANDNATGNAPAPRRYHRTVADGLRLQVTHYAPEADTGDRRPVVCLAGLTRNGRDFDVLANALAHGAEPRHVYAIDMRGRGGSDFDPDWRRYTIAAETGDTIDVMTAEQLDHVAIIGTSRGGLIAMALMAAQPTRAAAIALNDIGPVIEIEGLARIAGYVGKLPKPDTWPEAVALCKQMAQRDFPNVTDEEWAAIARQWFNEEDGTPTSAYDPAIAQTFAVSADGIPELWPQFEAVTPVPVLSIRGARSDLLSAETVARMAERHPRLTTHTVPDEGHAPLLRDQNTISVIGKWLAATD